MQDKLTVPRDVQVAKYVALVGGELGAMIGEYKLSLHTGMPWYAAWSLPLLLSLYGFVAFRMGRTADVLIALGLVSASQGIAHLISAAVVGVSWQVIVGVWSLLVPIALWRLHEVVKPRRVKSQTPASDEQPELGAKPTPQPTQRRWKLVDAIAEVHRLEQLHPDWSDGQIGAAMGPISRVRVGQIRKEAAAKNMIPAGAQWPKIPVSV